MKFGCAITREPHTQRAGRMLLEDLLCRFDGRCDFAAVFFTPHHIEGILDVLDVVHERLSPICLMGCSAEGIIGADQEVERRPAIGLLAGSMRGVHLNSFHIDESDWSSLLREPGRFESLAQRGEDTRAWMVLGDPYTTPVSRMFSLFERVTAGVPVVGGMASGGGPGQNILVMNDRIHTTGIVGVSFSGPVRVDTVVSQGCRPIGRPLVVTAADENVIEQLGGRVAIEATREILDSLSPAEEEQLESGLLIGIVLNEYQAEFSRGDFLIRNLVGYDGDTGSITVSDEVRVGQTIQFQLRDAATADEDLRILMKRQGRGRPPAGGLVFSCNGRGQRLFDRPSHDVTAILDSVPTTPLAGFFAAGEFGPVGARNFIHGHTASIALFRERDEGVGDDPPALL